MKNLSKLSTMAKVGSEKSVTIDTLYTRKRVFLGLPRNLIHGATIETTTRGRFQPSERFRAP